MSSIRNPKAFTADATLDARSGDGSYGRLYGWSVSNTHATERLTVTFKSGGSSGAIIGEVSLLAGTSETVDLDGGIRYQETLYVDISATGTCSGVVYLG